VALSLTENPTVAMDTETHEIITLRRADLALSLIQQQTRAAAVFAAERKQEMQISFA
jgi:hypothetical protein